MGSTSNRNWILIDDRPIATEEADLLWKNDNIHEELQQIAKSVVSPLYLESSKRSFSMTFAIYGHWGTGKSSALRILKEKAEKIAQEKKVCEQLKICEYTASAYEILAMDARISLAQRIITTLADGQSEAVQQWADQGPASGGDEFSTANDPRSLAGKSFILQNWATTLSRLIDFDKIIQEKMRGSDGKPRVLLILIDDLDRCTNEFIWQILTFTQQLSDVPNLFFVLAVEEDYLKKAIGKLLKRESEDHVTDQENKADSDFFLEKYIQQAISVPAINQDDSLLELMKMLMNNYGVADPVDQVIQEYPSFFLRALKLKLFGNQSLKSHYPSPRYIKRFLNSVRSVMASSMKEADAPEKRLIIAKKEMLRYVWPVFYRECFLPTLPTGDEPLTDKHWHFKSFALLEAICFEFILSRDKGALEAALKEQLDVPFNLKSYNQGGSLNLELVEYLGTEPFLYLPDSSAARRYLQHHVEIIQPYPEKQETTIEQSIDLQSKYPARSKQQLLSDLLKKQSREE